MERPATKILNTTLGELIAAASEVAFEYSDNDKDAYRLARLTLIEILKKSPNSMVLDEDFDLELAGKKRYH
jgi:hypothetical protein